MSEIPNYTTEMSRIAEERVQELISLGETLGVEVHSLDESKHEIIDLVRTNIPDRLELVTQKLKKNSETNLVELSKQAILDKLLGIDVMFRLNGKTFAVDVTTAKSSGIINKQRKISSLEDTYRSLGIDHALIIRLKSEVTEDTVIDLFARLENLDDQSTFTVTLKYPQKQSVKSRYTND